MSVTDLSKYKNIGYNPGGFFKRLCWYFVNSLFFKSAFLWPSFLKNSLLKLFGAKVGTGVVIKPNVNIKYPWYLEIGNHTWIGEEVWIDNLAQVTIGNNVCVSQGALILSGNHNYKSTSFDLVLKEINVEDGSWVGAKSIVTQGVTLKSHSVLAVGSVASKDLESYSVYQGNPAVKIRNRVIK